MCWHMNRIGGWKLLRQTEKLDYPISETGLDDVALVEVGSIEVGAFFLHA
jgi:hypothetical protein